MSENQDPAEHQIARMRFGRFAIVTLAQFALALLLFFLISPSTFAQEWSQAKWIPLVVFLFGIPMSLFEYLYHRYLLHSAVLPFLKLMQVAHVTHHSLTSVKAAVRADEPTLLVPVKNEFAVEHEHQEDSMEFPFFAVSIFMAIFTLLLAVPTKLLLPDSPAFLSVLVGVTIYYSAYELWHAILHLPYERFWRPNMEHRIWGRLTRHTYSFHLMHHWRPTANLAIVGFWGIALWDYVFRTHRRPERLPLRGSKVSYVDASIRKPLWPIAWLDRVQAKSYRWSRQVEAWFARLFLGRKAPR